MTPNKIDNSIIHVGIDLGTTNSEVAACYGDDIDVIKNSLGDQYTPSVFGIDKAGNKLVGKKAYDKLYKVATEDEIANNKGEVKRLMGTNEHINFPRLGKTFTPEEVSAEILKSLRGDVIRKYPDSNPISAVITVPAYFESLQNEATKRAGQLAGFDYVVLLQEPIAAAISYGFNSAENANWLVYDLGGGTFDVALISSQDGILKVLEHGGDNFLGGKDIDRALVNEVLKPAILREYTLRDFELSNKKYETAFAKLKAIAESVKIDLTTSEVVSVEIDGIGEDDNGKDIYLSFEYSRTDFNELIRPIIDKTIDVAKDVIEESGVAKKFISKVVFVGGPTQIPYLRQRVAEDLGIEIDTSVDPLTTVARGACIYGLGRRVPEEILAKYHENKANAPEVKLTLNYESMTSDEDEMITGSLELPDDGEYYVKISSENGFYNSANIKVKNGKFFDTLAIEPNKTNRFWIYLLDGTGNNIPVYPDSFSITHGLTIQGAPIPHDVGVIYSRKSFDSDFQFVEDCDKYFERSSILPLETTKSYKTARQLEKGAENPLPIKIYEGDSDTPEANTIITTLNIDGDKLPYNMPKGTDIDLTIRINESREVRVEAYIPSIDLTIESESIRVDTYAQEIDENNLRHEIDVQRQRAENSNMSKAEREKVETDLESIEDSIGESGDADSRQKASRDIKKLKQKIDDIESSSAIETLAKQYRKLVGETEEVIDEVRKNDISLGERLNEQLAQIKDDGEKAIANQDKIMLVQLNDQLASLKVQAVAENPYFWVIMLEDLERRPSSSYRDSSVAQYHINAANNAKSRGDVEELKRNVRELLKLLPQEEQASMSENMSGITK